MSSQAPPSNTSISRPAIQKQFMWSEELADFLAALDHYHPTIPVEVTQYYLAKAGVTSEDPRIVKLVSLAGDKFMAGVINDAKQIALVKNQHLKAKSKRKVLEETLDLDDLERSLGQHRIHVKRRRIISQPVAEASSTPLSSTTSR